MTSRHDMILYTVLLQEFITLVIGYRWVRILSRYDNVIASGAVGWDARYILAYQVAEVWSMKERRGEVDYTYVN